MAGSARSIPRRPCTCGKPAGERGAHLAGCERRAAPGASSRNAAAYDSLVSRGLCPGCTCKAPMDAVFCADCAAGKSVSKANLRGNRIAAGLCGACGAPRDEDGATGTRCADCAERHRATNHGKTLV